MKTVENPILYITRDKERGEGKSEGEDYSIISGDGRINTENLLKQKAVSDEINKNRADIVVFKNSLEIEKLAKQNGWKLLNPSAELSERIENKITQEKFLGELGELFPPHEITTTKNVSLEKKPFVLQWAHGHTGESTILVGKEIELEELKKKFPDREARVSKYIHGPVFTVNVVVLPNSILIGNISYQITGIAPFTDNPMSTIGNDWTLPYTILSKSNIEKINNVANQIGEKMAGSGWKGLLGIDVVYEESLDSVFLLEINARQPASATFESQLQMELRKKGIGGITVFEAHIAALAGRTLHSNLIEINDGAQIIKRVTNVVNSCDTAKLEVASYHVITYMNTKLNSDLIRIQSARGIMEAHGIFNKRGKEILSCIS